MTFEYPHVEDIGLLVGTFDHPERVPPVAQYGIESRMPWYSGLSVLPGDRPTYADNPQMLARISGNQPSGPRHGGLAAGVRAGRAMAELLTGGCQCGAVRFKVTRRGRAAICHCRMCQKAFGAFVGPLVTAEEMTWTRGAPKFFRSSNLARRGFCADCGTPLCYQQDGNSIELAIGAFDSPAAVAPVVQFNLRDKASLLRRPRGFAAAARAGRATSCASSSVISIPTATRPIGRLHGQHEAQHG